jgi:hypothetical protein
MNVLMVGDIVRPGAVSLRIEDGKTHEIKRV